MTVALIWLVFLAGILLMLLRPRSIPEWIWIGGAALLLVAARLIPLSAALHTVRQGFDVCLFLAGMMILAELAREEGVFDWIAEIAVRRARGSSSRLFFLVYLSGTIVTALLSNDATAVVLTPAVLAAARRARVHPRPCLLACAMVANAASFVLPISNPANLVVFQPHLPPLGAWLRALLLPAFAAVAATFLVLRIIERRELAEPVASAQLPARLQPAGRLALLGILIAAAALLVASGFGIPLGAPTLAAAILAMILVATLDRSAPRTALRQVSWSVLPLVAGLFILVSALNRAGLTRMAQDALHWLAHTPDGSGKFVSAFAVAALSNAMNNLPVGLAAGSALRQVAHAPVIAHAVLIGVDLGPNLSVTGSLATILWLIALRREHEEITAWQFLRVGLLVMPISLALALLALR
ncbi:MAG TPA: SLC13 family permease [Acidobacteriaceae bacterium]|nr:SLC13 family permease [Acidobacteriaceae bacterium]HTX41787.1 SLC13 family permease [Acidobacteriaceae bacterium]